MKRWIGGLLSVVGLATTVASARAEVDPAVLAAEKARVAVVAKARATAVAVFAPGGQGGGSGVVISPDGFALSNFHVTKGSGDAMKCGMADGKLYDAVIVGIDPVGDVALIKLFGRNDFPHTELADSDQVQIGDWAFAVGNPFLLATDFQPTVTWGIISGTHRYQEPAGTLLEYTDCIQTDASINPGNSGGPLFDAQGRLIGINGRGSFEKRGRVNVGVGYAISINQIKNFLGCLKSGRIIDHATLGAQLKTDGEGRAIVYDILEDSDAFRRGLRSGDEVLSFGGRQIRTVNAFKNVLGIYPKGWRAPLTYRRKGESFDVLVRLAGVHATEELLEQIQGPGNRPQPQPAPDNPQPAPKVPPKNTPKVPPKSVPQQPKAEMPEIVKKHFAAKRGYANFYFNQVNRDRVWGAMVARGSFTAMTGNWTVSGELVTGGEGKFEISERGCHCELPGGQLKLDVGESLVDASDPPGSGGLLAALHLWRRLLVVGPEKFGELHYVGSFPLQGRGLLGGQPSDPLVDVLSGTFAGVECRFYFDPATGHLLCEELYLHPDEDPCELHFSQFEEIDGRPLPKRLEVRYGDDVYLALKIADWKLAPAAEK